MNLLKKYLSFIFPIQLEKTISSDGDDLYLMLNRGRLQLGTKNAIYSWEDLYYPFVVAFKKKSIAVKKAQSCLIVGFGMGSIISILNKQIPLHSIKFIGIEKENSISVWAKKYKAEIGAADFEIINADAHEIEKFDLQKFDLICVDVFKNRSVPAFAQTKKYLSACNHLLNDNGILFFNSIPKDAATLIRENFETNFKTVFPKQSKIILQQNELWIGEK